MFGSNVDDYVYAQVPSHMAIDYSHEASQPSMSGLHETMEKALAGGAKGSAEDEASSEDAGAGEGGAPAGGPGGPGGPGGGVTMLLFRRSGHLGGLPGLYRRGGRQLRCFGRAVQRAVRPRARRGLRKGSSPDDPNGASLLCILRRKGGRQAYGHDVRLAGEPQTSQSARSETAIRSPACSAAGNNSGQPLRIPVHDVRFGREPGLRARLRDTLAGKYVAER